MGVYEQKIFPRIMNAMMSSAKMGPLRTEALAKARGRVLEVGFGTGLNLPFYPDEVEEIVGVDPNEGMNPIAKKRVAEYNKPVTTQALRGEALPFEEQSFDTVVTSFSLCSIADTSQALSEVARVLKPDGRLLLVEHGLADDPKIQKWQRRLNRFNQIIACGCNLDRDIKSIVENAGFEFENLRTFYMAGEPKPFAYLYLGDAKPSLA